MFAYTDSIEFSQCTTLYLDGQVALCNPLQRGGCEVHTVLQYANNTHSAIIGTQLALVVPTCGAQNEAVLRIRLQLHVGEGSPGAAAVLVHLLGPF